MYFAFRKKSRAIFDVMKKCDELPIFAAFFLTKLNSILMNKVMLRWAFCLILFPAVHASAQDAKTVPNSSSTSAPNERLGGVPMQTDAASAPDEVKRSNMAGTAPVCPFPDSIMRKHEIEIFQSVLKVADLAKFKYMDAIAGAKAGDVSSMQKLLDFNRVVDGVDALNHAVTCLELIPVAGDHIFGTAVYLCTPKMKKVLLERLTLAQGRTKKTYLRQPLANWAPSSWSYLNMQVVEETATGTTIRTVAPAATAPASTPQSGKQ